MVNEFFEKEKPDYVFLTAAKVGGEVKKDTTKPNGSPRKLMDVSKLTSLGWKASISLEKGIASLYKEIKDYNWN